MKILRLRKKRGTKKKNIEIGRDERQKFDEQKVTSQSTMQVFADFSSLYMYVFTFNSMQCDAMRQRSTDYYMKFIFKICMKQNKWYVWCFVLC